ncbi:putative nuclease HARBI1 [Ceratitis capitata]|uniref:putative nuclease HARBI1 n=1 Tax=Ceratitis capitata TaxID=7213 RepID=UPI000A0FF6FA|nr:putative nuclease HARBI1 [Ceratitis capitata]
MQRSFESGNHNMFLIGDSGYLLEPWLMTPLPNQPQGSPKFRYNEAFCKARNPVERLFGVLKGTWQCLSQQRTLLYDAGFTGRIVNACSVLHNIRLGDQIYELGQEFLENRTNTVNFNQQQNASKIA